MKPTQTRRFLLYDYFSKNVFNPVWTLVDMMWSDVSMLKCKIVYVSTRLGASYVKDSVCEIKVEIILSSQYRVVKK